MEPAFYRGDILFLHMGFTPFRAGDIVVFKVADREIPIVHRIIKVNAALLLRPVLAWSVAPQP